MSAIGPGDWVEYILPGVSIPFGSVHLVTRLLRCGECPACGDAGPGIALRGFDHSTGYGFCAGCEVRPIYRPKQSLIEQLSAPAPSVMEPA